MTETRESTKAPPAPALWVSNGGHITCSEHGGGYFTSHLRAHPRARRFVTSLDVWEKVTEADRAYWLAEMGEPMTCEACPKEAQ